MILFLNRIFFCVRAIIIRATEWTNFNWIRLQFWPENVDSNSSSDSASTPAEQEVSLKRAIWCYHIIDFTLDFIRYFDWIFLVYNTPEGNKSTSSRKKILEGQNWVKSSDWHWKQSGSHTNGCIVKNQPHSRSQGHKKSRNCQFYQYGQSRVSDL